MTEFLWVEAAAPVSKFFGSPEQPELPRRAIILRPSFLVGRISSIKLRQRLRRIPNDADLDTARRSPERAAEMRCIR